MPTIWTEVEVDVDLAEFDTSELLEELESRDVVYTSGTKSLIQRMYDYQAMGKDIQPLLEELYWSTIKRIA